MGIQELNDFPFVVHTPDESDNSGKMTESGMDWHNMPDTTHYTNIFADTTIQFFVTELDEVWTIGSRAGKSDISVTYYIFSTFADMYTVTNTAAITLRRSGMNVQIIYL